MKKIDLSNYKLTQIYFNFFDIYFKEKEIKKPTINKSSN